MIKTIAALGLLAGAGLSICPLCGSLGQAPVPSLAPARGFAQTPAPAMQTVTLRVEGMTCGGCVIATKKVLTRLSGVTKADVSYEDQRAVVTYDANKVSVDRMIAAIKTLGYKASVVTG